MVKWRQKKRFDQRLKRLDDWLNKSEINALING